MSRWFRYYDEALDDPKVHFARVIYTLAAPADLGAAGHPNALGHTKIANALIPVFNSLLGTNWGSAPHGTPLAWLRAHGFTNDFAADLGNDGRRACPKRGRVGCRAFPDCF